MALNYVHNGLKPVPLALLGRKPNHLQSAVYERLRALLVACDRPDEHPLPPGRSGFEFICKLVELEKFCISVPGLSCNHYAGAAEAADDEATVIGSISKQHGFEVLEEFSPIFPYRSLDSNRLKLTGTGQWPMEKHLKDELWLPFVEPAILLHHAPLFWEGPDCSRESHDENLALARLWDSKGLLALFNEEHPSGLKCRVFNCHKNATTDRQIGDRRWLNGSERHPRGPSANLPSGDMTTSMHCPTRFKLVGCTSDRRDFYHQAQVTRQRAFTNLLPFRFRAADFKESPALEELYAEVRRPYDREADGDRYGLKPKAILAPDEIESVYAGFRSLFQGDHLGVEYALSSHCQMLRDGGLLQEATLVERGRAFPHGPLWEGVVIDDFFSGSREKHHVPSSEALSVKHLEQAEKIYLEEAVLGSDEKTVRGEEKFKIIGAEVLSDWQARSAGVVLVSSPVSKRIPMSCLSFRLASMPVISRALASRAAGNWVSIFMFRRCLCCILSEIFGLGSRSNSDDPEVVDLSRRAAEELCLAGIFGLIAVSDISVPYDKKVYATDASMNKGAYTSIQVSQSLSETLWLGGDRKGAYTMLDSSARCQLRSLGVDTDELPNPFATLGPSRTLDFAFDAVEICGGSGVLSEALAKEGLTVCPPIDISSSPFYDLRDLRLIEWIFEMIRTKRFKALICERVCTTFSPAQHPASRSYSCPTGFNRLDRKTFIGNLIAFRCLAIMWYAFRCDAIALLEQPKLSKMAWLSMWRFLLKIGFSEAFVDSCAFGCIHRKPFRFLIYGLQPEKLTAKCPGNHQHVRIEGKYTKQSAIYHPGLARFLAEQLASALRAKERADAYDVERPKHESAVLNDLLLQPGWKVESSWDWKQPAHINVLESRAFVNLLRGAFIDGGNRRINALLDSRVAKGAHGKGRSSSRMLRPSLLRASAYSIAGNIYSSLGFAPTRLNTADSPTRERPLPVPASLSILDFLDQEQVACLHSHQFSRATAGWIRLFILVAFCFCPGESCESFNLQQPVPPGSWNSHLFTHFSSGFLCGLSFSCCLISTFACISVVWIFLSAPSKTSWNPQKKSCWFKIGVFPVLVLGLSCFTFGAAAMPLQPTNTGDWQRASRRQGNILQTDRVILTQTRKRRDSLLEAFDAWLSANWRTTLSHFLDSRNVDFEEITEALVAYEARIFTKLVGLLVATQRPSMPWRRRDRR